MSSQRPPQPQPQPQPRPRPQSQRREAGSRTTLRLRDLHLGDRDTAHYVPRMGDWLLLAILVVIFLGNGIYIWLKMGANSHAGRAIFFGLLLLCVLWAAIVYTFKLSVCVRVGPHGMSVVRGPWSTELAWRDVARLTERSQVRDGQRFRWLVALARDGRRMQIRDDMVLNYERFRLEVYERFRLWNDHGGTWGTTGGGPYAATEMLSGQTTWWTVGAVALGLPGVYFWVLLPETNPLGFALTAAAVVCGMLSVRSMLARQSYVVDGKVITVRRPFRSIRLPWREVARVERTRTTFGGAIQVGIIAGRLVLKLAARTDGRVESFDWSPRIPEYLILRGAGHQARIRLHRLERPDEMLAWVEFYDNVARHAAESVLRRTGSPARALASLPAPQPAEDLPADLSAGAGPLDPWGAGRGGETQPQTGGEAGGQAVYGSATPSAPPLPSSTRPTAPTNITSPGDSWLRAEPSLAGESTDRPSYSAAHDPASGKPEHARAERDVYGAQRAAGDTLSAADAPATSAPPRRADPVGRPVPERPSPPPERTPQSSPLAADWQPPQWLQHDAAPGARAANASQVAPEPPYRPDQPYQPWPHAQTPSPWPPQPTAPLPPFVSQDAPQPARPPRPGHVGPSGPSAPGEVYSEWVADEVEPGAEEDAPTDSAESLAESFAAWRDDATWQPPPLPRFGPGRGPGQSEGS